MAGQTIAKVVAGGKTHTISSSFYGTCATAAATAAKEVIINDVDTTEALTAVTGMTLAVKFTNSNTASNPTLTLFNNSGTAASPTKGSTTLLAAKSIKRYGTTAPGTAVASSWTAGAMVLLIYDGTYWVEVTSTDYDTNDNTVPSVYIGTAAGTAAKVGTMTNGVLATGYYYCLITTTNTSAGAITLNINGKGAKPIYINGTASSSSNYSLTAGSYIVYYNGTNFYFRTDGKIPQLKTSGSIGVSTTNVGSASAGTAIAADDITAWSAGTVPTLGTAIAADDITAWTTNTPTAVTKKTVVTGTTTTNITVSDEVLTLPASILTAASTGDSATVTAGTAASLSYTARSIPNVTAVGTAPSLSYTARSIPNISVTSTSVVTGLTEA